jgi:hypothetical protein
MEMMETLRLSKPLFKSALIAINSPSESRRVIDWLWAQVQVKVDKERLGNATGFTWPC